MRVVVVLGLLVAAVAALPAKMPEPGELALLLGEEEFEDYLDAWLATQEPSMASATRVQAKNGCAFRVNGDLGQPQPVYIHGSTYLKPSDKSGNIFVNAGDSIRIACTWSGSVIAHPNIASSVGFANATCVNDNLVVGSGWLSGPSEFGGLTCSSNAYHLAQGTTDRCYGNNLVIRVGFIVDNVFHPWYYSCFDQDRLQVLYVWYDQDFTHATHQTGVARPSWLAGSFFPGLAINNLYTQVQQKLAIAGIVGDALADYYVTSTQFLARGHLAAKSDYVFATGQRSTFYFINAAPQWQPFNGGNWNWLEQNLRARIGDAGYETLIYTGTFGVSQLRDAQGVLRDIYLLEASSDNPRLPVPLYYYKVVVDAKRRIGTAFVSINNPYYTAEEVRALQFCTDHCRNNDAFNWLRWQADRIDIGYSFCCTIADFQKVVPHLPTINVDGLLA